MRIRRVTEMPLSSENQTQKVRLIEIRCERRKKFQIQKRKENEKRSDSKKQILFGTRLKKEKHFRTNYRSMKDFLNQKQ